MKNLGFLMRCSNCGTDLIWYRNDPKLLCRKCENKEEKQMFTKQHYECIANLLEKRLDLEINRYKNGIQGIDPVYTVKNIIHDFQKTFKKDNPKFDNVKFFNKVFKNKDF